MNIPDKNTERKEFDKYIHAISVEIEQAQIRLVSAANVQMLFHYWKLGCFILYNQRRLGWAANLLNVLQKHSENYIRKRKVILREILNTCVSLLGLIPQVC